MIHALKRILLFDLALIFLCQTASRPDRTKGKLLSGDLFNSSGSRVRELCAIAIEFLLTKSVTCVLARVSCKREIVSVTISCPMQMRALSTVLRPQVALMATRTFGSNVSYSVHASFSELVDKYDGFILDQFGVLHNGVEALDGAVECVEHLAKNGKKLIILSNTSAPAKKALERLPVFGFDASHFSGAVTSGEEASRYIRETYGQEPSKAIFLTWDVHKEKNARLTAPPLAFLEQCGKVKVATSIEEADFVILHGSEIWYRGSSKDEATWLGSFIEEGGFEAVDPLLHQCLDRKLPLVCANPDIIVRTPEGGTAYMPGRIAERYADLGGTCTVFGKPGKEHFQACLRELGLPPEKCAHVGDSLHHDISGANAAGVPNVFVTSGIHANDFGTDFGELPDKIKMDGLFTGNSTPSHVISAFRL